MYPSQLGEKRLFLRKKLLWPVASGYTNCETAQARSSCSAACKPKSRFQWGRYSVSDSAERENPKFDWVAERSACTLPKMFMQLRAEIEGDVKERNAQRPDNSPYEFVIVEKDSGFSVVLEAKDYRRAVTFMFEDHAIIVLDPSGNQMFEVTLLFTDDGKCRLKAKEENRETWQVRRMALEDLLFRTA
jgi:hypothetical protein